MTQRIFLSAGDVSGDIHAANLVKALRAQRPGVHVTSLGGPCLATAADEFLFNLVGLSGFGFWEPVRQYATLRRVFREHVQDAWKKSRPDIVILVDYYGFNIHIAQEARRLGIPVYYYVSPQVWASRPGRVRKLAKAVTKMLVILPFEEELYRKAGVDVAFVGHPLLDLVPEPAPLDDAALRRPVIGFFPGSRKNVVNRHLGICDATAEILRRKLDCETKLFANPSFSKLYAPSSLPVVSETGCEERRKIAFAVTTSGTVCLELTLLGIPMAVFYRLSGFNYRLAKMLVKVPYITMANILAGRQIVPEFIQDDAQPERIAEYVVGTLGEPERYKAARQALLDLRRQLGSPGVSERAAQIILQ